MAGTRGNLDNLEVTDNIFSNIKFFVSGEISEKVVDLLKSGGAERLNYFSDYVTHLICGENPEENDISDANDLYEIPAVTANWVFMCIKLKKLVNTKPYIYNLQKLFSSLVFCLSKPGSDRDTLWAIISYNGGVVQLNLDSKCTHLVTIDVTTPKYEKASSLGSEKIVIITPDWIVESVKNNSLAQADLFHPKLIKWPKVIKHESTTAITGFEPEKVEPVEKTGDSQVTDSTQALLDKLKQRMPWIQPQTSSTGDIVPPNVVAPSFLSKAQQNQIRTFTQTQVTQQQPPPSPVSTTFVQPPQNAIANQQIPRSIVHHTPQPQQMMQQQQQQSPQPQQQPAFNLPNQLHLNRLIGQQQNRPTLQQLRSQLGPTQLHHHLLQQRIVQQQNQQNAQRPLSLQQQQLLQQQLAQGQLGPARQLLQNQQQQQLSQLNQQILQNQQQTQLQQSQLQQQGQVQQPNQQLNQMQQPVSISNQQFGNVIQPQHILQQQQQQQGQVLQQQQQGQVLQQQQQNQILQQQQNQVLQQQQNQVLQQQQQNQVLQQQQQNQVLQQQQQQNQVLQQQQQNQVLQQQQQQQIQNLQQQQNQVLQQQQQSQVLQQQQQNPVLQQQQQNPVLQQGQILQQQNKIFVSQQQQQTPQQIVQNQPNLAIQQQFVSQNQQQFPQQQSPQQQPNQHFVQNQDLNQQQNLLNQQVVQSPQFPQNNIINQQLLLNQQNQFNQQQPNQSQPRPQINQHLWQQQQQQQQQGQQPQQQQQMTVRHPVNIVQQGPRIQWSPNQQPNQPQRQYIHLDAQTHNELQKMNPEQQALFVQRLKQKQLLMQKQLTQRAGGGHILIRGAVPPGLNAQQQMQWLQRQAKQQGVVLPPNIQQQTITPGALTPQNIQTPNIQHTPGLSPIQQQPPPFADQNQQQQLQLRQQYRIQQLQLQREQAQKNQLAAVQQQQQPPVQPVVVRPPLGPVIPDSTTNPPDANVSQQLVVNAKTKTALANMLSNRLQSGGGNVGPVPEAIPEPSAAGTLRLMTAQHNAALNPNNRPQDLIALQQRRVINGPNGEIIRALVPQAVPVMPPNEPPKVTFSPRAAVPMQHRPGPYYGHNPNLKLPPDLFLLGCIFVVVEIERYLDESIPGWQQKIEKYGGEVEKQYCTRVTHVLCETQRHGVVMQALRDCKRCVTVYWLSDVIKRKQVLPPWTALHLPAIYFDSTPAAKHLITLSGFSGCERSRVKHMITYTGAKFTSYFSKHNTILIAAKAEGTKYAHAKKWGIPVVNVQWLTDIMLGNFTALNQTEHIMYQQFPTPPNFSFDPKLIPTLMHGWKAPINISQDSYERVKRSPSPVLMPKKAKKVKTEQTDENDNVNDEGVEVNYNYRILFSMSSEVTALQKIVRQLGGVLAKNHQDCTHLVMPSLARTNKLLFCICREVYIMPEQWLKDSHSAQKFLDEANYSLDTKDFNSEYKCDFMQTLNTKNRNKLFEGKSFWITPSVFPSKSALVELVQSCGGVVERIRRTAAQIEATNINAPYSYIIITHENDIHLVADLLRNKKDKVRIVCSAELIFSAILKQTFEVEPYAVKVL